MEQDIRKLYEKTMKRKLKKKIGSISIVVTEDTYDKALTAFNIGVGGAELGIKVCMFFTSRGVNILKRSYKPRKARWGESPIGWKETYIKKRGGPILANLMYQARDLGIDICICYSSMIASGLKEKMLISDIRVLRISEFLEIAIDSDAQFVI
jgi:predicted peroxiredoxin